MTTERVFLTFIFFATCFAASVQDGVQDSAVDDINDDDLPQMVAFVGKLLTEKQKAWFEKLGSESPSARNSYEPDCMRREFRNLTGSEQRSWHNAVKAMTNTMIDGMSQYDIFVTYHQSTVATANHQGAAFLPWHREYTWRMERALREHDPWLCLPYWDSTLEVDLPVQSDSAIWTPEYFGNAIGTVGTPFPSWSILPECESYGLDLTRDVGAAGKPFNDEDVHHVYNHTAFEEIVCNIDCSLEDDNAGVLSYVGGHMGGPECSPTDPVFWLHQAFVDLIWEEFRQNYQLTDIEFEYPEHSEEKDIGGTEHNPYSSMEPFAGILNIAGLSSHYTNYYYQYYPRPIACERNEDCGGEYIWCDTNQGRCRAKVQLWGDCTGFPDDACACTGECIPEDDSHTDDPQCINDVCII